jgi:hypothetical protein
MAEKTERFDPRAILAALQRSYVDYVLIGGVARVLRGSYEITQGVDICPSFAADNLDRLEHGARELQATTTRRGRPDFSELALATDGPTALKTTVGELRIVAAPAGVPNGFVDLRRAATREDLGHGVRPLVASTADLARMAAALHRPQDVERLRELRRIMELEVERGLTVPPPAPTPSADRRRVTARTHARSRGLER